METNGQLHDSDALTTGKEPQLPMEQEAGCDPQPICLFWRRENSLVAARNRTTIPPSVVQSVAKSSRVKRSGRVAITEEHSVPRLRILGVVPPLIHKPSCCVQRQHCTFTFIRVSCTQSRRYYVMLNNKAHTF